MSFVSVKKIAVAEMDAEFRRMREAGGTVKEIIFLNGTIRTIWALPATPNYGGTALQ
jgi:hypothetical protein